LSWWDMAAAYRPWIIGTLWLFLSIAFVFLMKKVLARRKEGRS
jgi:hypothetical protein